LIGSFSFYFNLYRKMSNFRKKSIEGLAAPGRKVDPSTLIGLNEDGSNALRWRATLNDHFASQYEFIGNFLEDKSYYVRTPWTQEQWRVYQEAHHLSATQIVKQKAKRAEDFATTVEKDGAAYQKMYATVMQTLSDKHKADLRRDPGFDAVQLARLPMQLVDLCQSVLVNKVSGLPADEQADTLLHAFEMIHQLNHELIDQYVERAKASFEQLGISRVPDAPQLDAAIRRVTRGLARPRYTGFLVHLANTTRSGGEWPKTWSDIVLRAT
jgi:hypothetical protein